MIGNCAMTPADCIRLAAAEHDVPEARLVGPYKRPRAVAMARATAVKLGLANGFTRADMARALGVDWGSVNYLARKVWA
jgi:hypothetical protein